MDTAFSMRIAKVLKDYVYIRRLCYVHHISGVERNDVRIVN